jgi:hypothetical protein
MNPTSAHVLAMRARIADEIREAARVDHATWQRICREVRVRVDRGLGEPSGRALRGRAIATSMAASDELHDDRAPARDVIVEYLRRHGCTSKETGARQADIIRESGRDSSAVYNATARLYEAGVIRKTFSARSVIWLRDA